MPFAFHYAAAASQRFDMLLRLFSTILFSLLLCCGAAMPRYCLFRYHADFLMPMILITMPSAMLILRFFYAAIIFAAYAASL